jgi:hypothetical protein
VIIPLKRRPVGQVALAALALVLLATPAQAQRAANPGKTAAATRTAPRNLLQNPGFEKPLAGHAWMPAAWDTFASGLPTVFFGRDTFLVRSGQYSVNVANLSTYVPMYHNWSQTLLVGREVWGKDAVLSVWTRSNGLQGRAYVLVQAYRDTIGKMSRIWNIRRDDARVRLGILPTDDPLVNLGWDREYFSDFETDWVKREVRIFIPPSTNSLVVRAGVFGTGQVLFDDASLTVMPTRSWPELPLNTNLLADPGFEEEGNDWEYSMPPYEGLRIERDTTVAHTGRASVHLQGGLEGPVPIRTGVCQVFSSPHLAGKRLRISGWMRTDSLMVEAFIKLYCSTAEGDVQVPATAQIAGTRDWTHLVLEMDAPPGTLMVWPWFLYSAPATGHLYIDDCSLEVIGPADYITKGTPPPRPNAR